MPQRRTIVIVLAGLAVGLGVAVVLGVFDGGAGPPGNGLSVLNAGTRGLDSIVVEADPPGTHGLAGRHGYLAPSDSALVRLPGGKGDADVRVWRDGRVVAEHVVYFGGRSWFEVRVGDSLELGRYRRTAR